MLFIETWRKNEVISNDDNDSVSNSDRIFNRFRKKNRELNDNTDEAKVTNSNGVFLSLLNKSRKIKTERDTNPMLYCISATQLSMDITAESPHWNSIPVLIDHVNSIK